MLNVELNLERELQRAYGLTGPIKQLPGELALNFALPGHLLKVHSLDTAPEILDLQDAALAAAVRQDVVAVPALVRTSRGEVRLATDAGYLRVLTWVPGTPWSERSAPGEAAIASLGRAVASVDHALREVDPALAARPLTWNMTNAADLTADAPAGLGRDVLERFGADVAAKLRRLPTQVVHNDANDQNILVDQTGRVSGLVDFGDVCVAPRICGLAVACAYAAFDLRAPLRQLAPAVAAYHTVAPLAPEELELLPDLIRVRLAMSMAMAVRQHRNQPDNDYLLTSQTKVQHLLEQLGAVPHPLEGPRLRAACGLDAVSSARGVRLYLSGHAAGPVCRTPLRDAPVIDWSTGSSYAGEAPAAPAIGRYLEDRPVYDGDLHTTDVPGERRSVHLGVDVFLAAGQDVLAPLDGVVADVARRPQAKDFGGVVVLEHRTDDGTPFWTLYGHLDRVSTQRLTPGLTLRRGEIVGRVGDRHENGDWPPHLHLQILTHMVDARLTEAYGVAPPAERDLWESVSPDPNLLLGLPGGLRAEPPRPARALMVARQGSICGALSLSYEEPLRIVDGVGAYLYDDRGRDYLDLVNNVCHVGHAHPRVVRAAAEQMGRLNTNTRYLHDLLVTYARRLSASAPDPLSVVFLVNSGSEANDLALRLARAHTGREDVVVLEHAYHGNLTSLIEISPYKFNGPGGRGPGPHVRVARLPAIASDADEVAIAARASPPAAFIAESLPGTAGQVVLPDGYLQAAYMHARAAGAVCIADEVQVGFGRVGSAFWGYELGGVVPDIVTVGKPIANGHPVGAVLTTPQIARSFQNGMEYFNTFGGNPVSCAAALAVLDVITDERLQMHAATVGGSMLNQLEALAQRHSLVSDVRGRGLFLGVELRTQAGEPARSRATEVVEHLKRSRILLSVDGPDRNVLKIKPPLVLTAEDADRFVIALDDALAHEC